MLREVLALRLSRRENAWPASEVIAARHVGMRVLGISLVSNMACGVEGASPSDVEVFEVAKEAEPKFCRLIEGIVEEAVL